MTLQDLAKTRFKEFCEQMEERIGSKFDPKDIEIFENVFINGYMVGMHDSSLFSIRKTNDN